MDYEEKYKTALERAKVMIKVAANQDEAIVFANTIFPELAESESEDERIRETLIDYFKTYKKQEECGIKTFFGIPTDNVLAWLEKQRIKPQGKSALEAIDEAQGTPAIKKCREHKFEKDDWINGYYTNYKVTAINSEGYVVEDTDGNKLNILFENEKFHHLFTIADAKVGDVLYLQHEGKEHIIIYKGVIKERFRTFVSAYCAYNCVVDAFCFADVSRYADITYGGIMPATKEQCNILFAKMKEAGYEWDAEKKELKKIEQSKLTEFEDAVKDMMDDYRDAIDANNATTEEVKKCAAYMLSLIPNKPADWSKEDERIMSAISQLLKDCESENGWNCVYSNDREVFFVDIEKWLQLIKERVI